MKLNIKMLHAAAKLPSYALAGDAGMDLFANEKIIISPGCRAVIPTGVAMEIPMGCVGLIWDKSGLSTTHGLKTLGGVIDAGYRGEIKIGIINLGTEDYHIDAGHKIAQMVIQKVEQMMIVETDELSETTRGCGGFGSTGE